MQSPVRIRRLRMTTAGGDGTLSTTRSESKSQLIPRVPLETLAWSFIPTRSRYTPRPRLRQGGAGGMHEGKLYLFGGFEDNGHRSNGLVQYDMQTHTWTDIDCFGNIPSPRYGHACCIYNKELWCFGGQGPEEGLNHKNIMGDLSILNLTTLEWRRGVVSCAGANGRVNFLPLARRGHSLLQYDHSLYLYAGSGPDRMYSKDTYFGDLQRLDVQSMCWHEPAMSGEIPEPRSQHAAIIVDGHMIVFGGQSSTRKSIKMELSPKGLKDIVVDRKCIKIEHLAPDTGYASNALYSLDLDTFQWQVLHLSGIAPSSRYGHTFTSHPSNSHVVFCFGGILEQGGYVDRHIHCMDLELQRWSTISSLDPIPPRSRHIMFAWQQEMMIFGGYGAEGLCPGDVYTIQLPIVSPALKRTPSSETLKALPSRPQTTIGAKSCKPHRTKLTISPIKTMKKDQSNWTSVGI